MNDNIHHIFSASGCPEHELLIAYFRNQLTEEERHRIESHLVDCPMCSDELEGLAMMEDPGKLDEIIEEIKTKVDRRQARVIRMNSRVFSMAAAAVLVLAIGTVFMIRLITKEHSPDLTSPAANNIVTQPEMIPPSSAEPSASGSGINDKKPESKSRRILVTGIAPASPGREEIAIMKLPVVAADSVTTFPNDTITLPSSQPAAGYAVSQRPVQSSQEPMAKGVLMEESKKESNLTADRTSTGAGDLIRQAMDLFNSGKYKEASVLFEQVLSQQQNNEKAMYYSAFCYYHLGKYAKASPLLDKILSDPASQYYAAAKSLSEKVRNASDSLKKN